MHIPERYLVKLSNRIDEILLGLVPKSDNIRPLLRRELLDLWMVLRIVWKHSTESAHRFSSKPDCNNIADVPLFTLRTARSAIPFVSDRWGVEVRWFHENSSQDLPNSNELSQCKFLLAFVTVWDTFVNSFPSPEKFLFGTDKSESIEWQDLAPRQRIGDCSEIHLPRWGFCDLPLSSPQTSPVPLLQEFLVILVLEHTSQFRSFGKRVSMLCFLNFNFTTTFVGRSESELCVCTGISGSSRFSVNSSNHSGSCNRSSLSILSESVPLRFPEASKSLRTLSGSCDAEGVISCILDVEDELLPGSGWQTWHDKRYEIVSFANNVLPIFWSTVVLDRWPTHRSTRVRCRAYRDRTAGGSSSNCTVTKRPRSWTFSCASSFVWTSPFAVTTVVGVLNGRNVSISTGLKSLLLSICKEAPESTTNIRSSGDFEIILAPLLPQENKNVVLSLFFELVKCFSPSPTLLCGPNSLALRWPSCDLSSNLGAQGLRSWGSHFWMTPRGGPFLSRILIWCQVPPENFTVCPADAFDPIFLTFCRIDFVG